jgi:thioredoxin 1
MSVITITKDNFETEVLKSEKPVLVDFWASWCGPCKMLSPIVDQLAEENSQIKVGKINVDDEQELATQFQVMSIPTLYLFKDGKVVSSSVGVKPKQALEAMIAEA